MATDLNLKKGFNDFANKDVSSVVVSSAIIGLWQGFGVGQRIQNALVRVPHGQVLSKVGVGTFQLGAGALLFMVRRKKAKAIEKSVYVAMLTNGLVDTIKNFASKRGM